MKKRIPSMIDIFTKGIKVLYILIFISLAASIVGFKWMDSVVYIYLSFLIAFCIYFVVSVYVVKPLPGQSVYHPLNVIEMHVGDTAKGDISKIMHMFYEILVISKRRKKSIIMSTWFFTADTLKKRLADAVTIYEPSKEDLKNGNKNKKKFKKLQTEKLKKTGVTGEELEKKLAKVNKQYEKPIINVYIDHSKITDEIIKTFERRFKNK